MVVRKKSDSKKSAKKLLEENVKTISSLKKQLKIPITDHPQIEELFTLQKQVGSLQQTLLNLEAKVLKLENDKQEIQKEKENLLMKLIHEDLEQVQKFSTD